MAYVLVLAYHNIGSTESNRWTNTPASIRTHIQTLLELGYTFTDLNAPDLWMGEGKKAVVTFDDGRCESRVVLDAVLSLFAEFHIKATFYICPAFLEGQVPPNEAYSSFLTWDDVRGIHDVGHIIGSHTMTHPQFTENSSVQAIVSEFQAGDVVLRSKLDYAWEPRHASVPYGFHSDAVESAAVVRVYSTMAVMGNRINYKAGGGALIHRFGVESPLDKAQLVQAVRCMEYARKPVQADHRPFVSFVIPARNEGHSLLDTVCGLRKFGPPSEVEIIVVDDASEPPLKNALENLNQSVCYIRLGQNRGVAAARHQGAMMSRGEVIVFTDGHVVFSANYLEELKLIGVASGWGIAGVPTDIVDTPEDFQALVNDRSAKVVCKRYYGWRLDTTHIPHSAPLTSPMDCTTTPVVPYVGGCVMAMSRELYLWLGGIDIGLAGSGAFEDLDLAMKCWAAGREIRLIPAVCWHLNDARVICNETTDNVLRSLDANRYPGSFYNLARILWQYTFDDQFTDLYRNYEAERTTTNLPPLVEVLSQSPALVERRRANMQHPETMRRAFDAVTRNPGETGVPDVVIPQGHPMWDCVDMFPSQQREFYERLFSSCPVPQFPATQNGAWRYWSSNDWFPLSDAYLLYAICRTYQPSKVIEIGSGFSTAVMLDAGVDPNRLTCIALGHARLEEILQTHPHPQLRDMDVVNADLDQFYDLEAGDIFFVDSSHICQPGSDVAAIISRILPVLADGVLVHFHDVFWTIDYPESWKGWGFNESPVLAGLLANNPRLHVLAFNSYMGAAQSSVFARTFPRFLNNTGGSLWFTVGDPPAPPQTRNNITPTPEQALEALRSQPSPFHCDAFHTLAVEICKYLSARGDSWTTPFLRQNIPVPWTHFRHSHANGWAHDFSELYLSGAAGRVVVARRFIRVVSQVFRGSIVID